MPFGGFMKGVYRILYVYLVYVCIIYTCVCARGTHVGHSALLILLLGRYTSYFIYTSVITLYKL